LPPLSVCAGDYVTLNASRTVDLEGDALSFAWFEQNAALPPLAGVQPTFRAPSQQATLTFEMTATDRCQLVGRSTQTVNVGIGNQAPQAFVAPHDAVRAGAQVTLDASASSDRESDPITFAWTQTAGPAVQLAGATTARPSFVAPALPPHGDVTLTFRVTVTDHPSSTCGLSESSTADVNVAVSNPNRAPGADAGAAQTVNELSVVTLDGTHSSDPDGDALTWQWTQTSGSPVQILGVNTARPTFVAPQQAPTARETLTFSLVVTDSFGVSSPPAAVSVTVQDIYAAPDCSRALPSVALLWPPDQQMETVRITNVQERDPEITLFSRITAIRQDEPLTGRAAAAINSNGSAQIRAQRAGNGDGRVYHISFTAADGFGGMCAGQVTVCVPSSATNACIDGGPLYDSTR
jgi:hypothetical protein